MIMKLIALYFTSCYNSRMYYRNLGVVIEQFECLIVSKISEGIAPRETIRFLTLRLISNVQRSWRHFCDVTITGSFQTGRETNICRQLQGLSQLSTFLYSQIILRFYAAINGLGGDAKTEFASGRVKP